MNAIKHATIVYFSPANHTEGLCRWISAQLPYPTELVSVTAHGDHNITHYTKEDLVIFAVPSFGGRVPAIALTKLQECKGNHTPCILLATYGNRDYDDTLLELKEAVESLDFQPIAAIAAICEHSIMKVYGAERPDQQDLMQLKTYLDQILVKLEQSELIDITVKGAHPFKAYHGIPLKPKTNSRCTSCGLCTRECPVNAIDQADPQSTDNDSCISCMRCISICPSQARTMNQVMVKASILKLKKECSKRKENELYL